ncbi:MAG TPA: hypothetical protein VGQ92_24060 [Actinoplanes sp.]|nr:hypothetical protein [Actinoplanes sp.]
MLRGPVVVRGPVRVVPVAVGRVRRPCRSRLVRRWVSFWDP